MTGHRPAARGHSRIAFIAERQLTIGECIAIARYGTNELDERTMTLGEIIVLIDRLEVCTTCGWSAPLHRVAADGEQVVGVCPQHTRAGVDNLTDH